MHVSGASRSHALTGEERAGTKGEPTLYWKFHKHIPTEERIGEHASVVGFEVTSVSREHSALLPYAVTPTIRFAPFAYQMILRAPPGA